CVAAKGTGKPGKPCFKYAIRGKTLNASGEMAYGDMKLFSLEEGATATVTIEPEKGFDVGGGQGKTVMREVRGGTVGLMLDARGRPLEPSQDQMKAWVKAMEMYSNE